MSDKKYYEVTLVSHNGEHNHYQIYDINILLTVNKIAEKISNRMSIGSQSVEEKFFFYGFTYAKLTSFMFANPGSPFGFQIPYMRYNIASELMSQQYDKDTDVTLMWDVGIKLIKE